MNERARMYLMNSPRRFTRDGHEIFDEENRYEMENRRGRDGRYLPKNESRYDTRDEYEDEYRSAYMRYPRRIGFSAESENDWPDEMNREYRSTYEYPRGYEMDRRSGGGYRMGGGETRGVPRFNREMAEEWVEKMESEDGKPGGKISIDKANQLMMQIKCKCDPYEFWAVINAVHSDYGKVFAKYGLGSNMEFLAEMAKAWICDADAVEDKASAYFMYVAK